jgi:hypothetical protein
MWGPASAGPLRDGPAEAGPYIYYSGNMVLSMLGMSFSAFL